MWVGFVDARPCVITPGRNVYTINIMRAHA